MRLLLGRTALLGILLALAALGAEVYLMTREGMLAVAVEHDPVWDAAIEAARGPLTSLLVRAFAWYVVAGTLAGLCAALGARALGGRARTAALLLGLLWLSALG